MTPALDPETLSPPARAAVSEGGNERLAAMAAKGVLPGVRPAELTAVLVLLSKGRREELAETARATLAALPPPVLSAALGEELHAEVIDALADAYLARADVVERLLSMRAVDAGTVERLAQRGSETITELVALNEQRLLAHPRIIERLYMNPATRMSTADRLVELAVRNGVELGGIAAWKEMALVFQGEVVDLPAARPDEADRLFREVDVLARSLAAPEAVDTFEPSDEGESVVDRFLPLYKRIGEMTMSQKIRRAMLGTKEERMLLVRDVNKIVASAAVRSPLMQEPDIVLVSRNRNLNDEVLRIVATTGEWLKSYAIKRNLVENPKTPQGIAMRLVPHIREADLRQIARSKNVSAAIATAARQHLERRK